MIAGRHEPNSRAQSDQEAERTGHHVGQCGTCPVKPVCVEGFWALRLNHDGALSPCLLREDLRLDLVHTDASAAATVAAHIAAFTEGTL